MSTEMPVITTYYFSYGSNMMASKMHLQNLTAMRLGAGKLKDYRLDFHICSTKCYGAPATIVPSKGSVVYGIIWRMKYCTPDDVDKQEGYPDGDYEPIIAPVMDIKTKETYNCRIYHLKSQPTIEEGAAKTDEIPFVRQPSKTYVKAMVKGAIEGKLPAKYIKWLRNIKHNGESQVKFEKFHAIQRIKLSGS